GRLGGSADPSLSLVALPRIAVPDGLAGAPALPDGLPPVKLRRGVLGLMRRHPTVTAGGGLVLILIAMALLAPFLATVDPTALAPARRTRAPSPAFWFGTDMLGRDIYSRVVYGARGSLLVGVSVALLSSV